MRESHFFFAREKVPLKLSEVAKKTRRLSLTNAFIPAAHATQRRFAVMRKMALISRVKKYEGERSSSAFLGLAGTPHPSQPKSHPYIHPSKISAFSFIINRSKSPILVHFDGNSCRKLIGFGAEFSASINCTRLHEFLLVKSLIQLNSCCRKQPLPSLFTATLSQTLTPDGGRRLRSILR